MYFCRIRNNKFLFCIFAINFQFLCYFMAFNTKIQFVFKIKFYDFSLKIIILSTCIEQGFYKGSSNNYSFFLNLSPHRRLDIVQPLLNLIKNIFQPKTCLR